MSTTPPTDPSPSTTVPPPENPALVKTLRQRGPGSLVFGRFRLVRELGAGGMAVVWLGNDERLGLEVALKFLPGMVASDPEALHDLRREITRGLRLTHPGIVRLYDLEEDSRERLAAITMEYVDGSTLADEKARQPGRCFEVAEPLLAWTRTLCEVLTYVHEKARVVHRDLKPRNLMLTAEGELKVADFGIAATLCDSHSRVSQRPGSSGTPVYMSPQQVMGNSARAADDIYALGATLYELLTSKPPFFRGNWQLILSQVSAQTPPSMAKRREELGLSGRAPIPPEWEETIAACLAKDPGERPDSMQEVAERLGLMGAVARRLPVPVAASPAPAAPGALSPPLPPTEPEEATLTVPDAPKPAPTQALPPRTPPLPPSAELGTTLPTIPTKPRLAPLPTAPAPLPEPAFRLPPAPPLTEELLKPARVPPKTGTSGWVGASLAILVLTGLAAALWPAAKPQIPSTDLPVSGPATPFPQPPSPPSATPTATSWATAPATPVPSILRGSPAATDARLATEEKPFENSLGMRFVPVPIKGGPTAGQRLLFSLWDTRVQDYATFVQETKHPLKPPAFLQGPTHPVVNVSWEDATAFCQWLSQKEGRTYRLPTDHEWSCAVGIGEQEEAAQTPAAKHDKVPGYPWGEQFPPPANFGNYSRYPKWDSYENTSPVGSFPANRFGIFDLSGNVWQWCESRYNPGKEEDYVLRGGSWGDGSDPSLRSSFRNHTEPSDSDAYSGFRCILVVPGD